jgi:hypothetical protein
VVEVLQFGENVTPLADWLWLVLELLLLSLSLLPPITATPPADAFSCSVLLFWLCSIVVWKIPLQLPLTVYVVVVVLLLSVVVVFVVELVAPAAPTMLSAKTAPVPAVAIALLS